MEVEAVKLALLKVSRSGHYSLVRQEDPTSKGFANSILRLLGYSFARSKPYTFTNIDLNRSVLLPFKSQLVRSLVQTKIGGFLWTLDRIAPPFLIARVFLY